MREKSLRDNCDVEKRQEKKCAERNSKNEKNLPANLVIAEPSKYQPN
jgi:hypothetical protein